MNSNAPQTASPQERSWHFAFCFLPHLPFVLLGLGAFYGHYWLLSPALFLLVLLPLLDTLTDWQDNLHFQKKDFSPLKISLLHWNTRLYAVLYMVTVLCFAIFIHHFQGAELGFLILSVSLLGGIGFAAAHELLHGPDKIDQFLQRIATTFLFYPHYKLIHTQSHHLHAATTGDKNTAWLDENIYGYILRTIPQSMIQSWQIEARRLSKRNLSSLSRVLQNQMIGFAIGQLGLLLALFLLSGPWGLLFYLGHVVGAHVVLESVNYIQHYGLLRHHNDGEYEKTGAEHSWDTYHFFSSYATFRVGHHSYHHIAAKPYYLLPPEPAAPKLPVGYFWAIPMVLVPPVWRRVINPKLNILKGSEHADDHSDAIADIVAPEHSHF